MLIGNYSRLLASPTRFFGGSTGQGHDRGGWSQNGMNAGRFSHLNWDAKSGAPDGYRPPYTWVLPMEAGGLSARRNLAGLGALVGAIAGGKNATATLSGTGSLTATGALIVSLAAALVGSGTISNAAAVAFLQLAATLAGDGDLDGALSALAHAAAALSGSGTATVTSTATGELAASITVTGDILTSANVASSVWGAIAASNNDVGTMGEKLNDAGSASNPWTEVIESGYTAAQILRLIAAAIQGDATGLESGVPAFKGLDGTTDRIVGTYVAGTRTVTTRDPD